MSHTYYAVVEDDPLDNGGNSRVIDGANHSTIQGPDGKCRRQTHLGQQAWCSVCQSAGEIAAGAGISDHLREWDERLRAREAVGGDIVLCKCKQHPRIVPVYARDCMYTDIRGGAPVSVSRAIPQLVQRIEYDQRFVLKDERSGRVLAGVPYRLVADDGSEIEGRTDSLGYTCKVASAGQISATVNILEDDSIPNPDWDKFL